MFLSLDQSPANSMRSIPVKRGGAKPSGSANLTQADGSLRVFAGSERATKL